MKRVSAVILSLCLLTLLTFSASAEAIASTRTVTFSTVNRVGSLAQTPETATFWESPVITAGQTTQTGKLVLHNSSANEVTISLSEVGLPYENAAALSYLDHITITVSDGAKVLYEGPYTRINEAKDGLAISERLNAGKDKAFTVQLHCAFTYTADASQAACLVKWKFAATTDRSGQTTAATNVSGEADPNEERVPVKALWIFVGAAGIIFLCALMGEILSHQAKKK